MTSDPSSPGGIACISKLCWSMQRLQPEFCRPISTTLAVLISYRSVPMILESYRYFVFLTLIHLELGWLQLQSYTFNTCTLPSLVLKLMPILQATLELVLSSVVY